MSINNWTIKDTENGQKEVRLFSWEDFSDFVSLFLIAPPIAPLIPFPSYIYRGQAIEEWKLQATLDRQIIKNLKKTRHDIKLDHLAEFRKALLGRRGDNPRELIDDNDLWAIGQHYGLQTPLLDWTESPFVALFFALHEREAIKRMDKSKKNKFSVVYALSETGVEMINKRQDKHYEEKLKNTEEYNEPVNSFKRGLIRLNNPKIEIIRPLVDENRSLISQRGLFTKMSGTKSIEEWVANYYPTGIQATILYKILVPSKDRKACLLFLNYMNINYLTLFPDMSGSAQYCNMALEIDNY